MGGRLEKSDGPWHDVLMQKSTTKPMDTSLQFCPNAGCSASGLTNQGNITIHDRKRERYRCKTCRHTFTARTGTMLEGLRKPAELILIVVGLLSYGCPLQAIVHVFGLDERTVAAWRDRAGQQCQRVQHAVVQQGQLTLAHVQADEIRIKGKKGILWMGLAMEVSSRLWLAGVVQHSRDRVLADRLLQMVRRCACGASQLLICVDGWAAYPKAILRAFTQQVKESIQARQAQMQVWPQLIIGQVIKTQKKYRLVSVKHTLLRGDQQGLEQCLEQSHGGTQINTAYIERFNGTMRERLASLTRKCRHANLRLEPFQWGMYLVGCTYNLCWPHHQLGQTPAVAAGLTDHVWSIKQVLTYKVTPQLLATMCEVQRQDVVQPPDKQGKPKSERGRASKYYLILLKLKQEKERKLSNAL
jgi:transposase-like protein/IS1 family transposase